MDRNRARTWSANSRTARPSHVRLKPAAQLSAGADVRPFAGPPLPRLEQRDALRRAAACERPHAAQRKNVGPSEFPGCIFTSCLAMSSSATLTKTEKWLFGSERR